MIQEKIKGENMGYRYIGSKARIVDEIMNYVDIYPGKGRFIDGFCGMGHVAIAAANKHWPVIVNDQMLYAGYISKARLLATSQAQFKNLGGYENMLLKNAENLDFTWFSAFFVTNLLLVQWCIYYFNNKIVSLS